MYGRAVLTIVCVLGAWQSCVTAGPIPAFDADKMFSKTTHVVVAEIVSDEQSARVRQEDTPHEIGTVEVQVRQHLIGLGFPDRLMIRLPRTYRPFVGPEPLRAGTTLLLMLDHREGGPAWELSDPHYGLIAVTAAHASGEPPQSVREAVEWELRKSLEDSDGRIVEAALRALALLRDRGPIARVLTLSKSDNLRVVKRALMYRLAVGDTSGLKQTVSLIEENPSLTGAEKEELAFSLAQADIPINTLNQLLIGAMHPTLRRVAATVLSQRGDKTSLAALLAGLSINDRETQYRCVVGLCRITGKRGPGYREFIENPTPTLEAWNAWREARTLEKG